MSDETLILQYKSEPDPGRRRAILEKLKNLEDFSLALELSSLLEEERDLGVKLLGRVIVNKLRRKHDFELFGEEGSDPESERLFDEPSAPMQRPAASPPGPYATAARSGGPGVPSPAPGGSAVRPAYPRHDPPAPRTHVARSERGPFLEGLATGWRDLPPALAVAALAAGLALLAYRAAGLLAVHAHDNLPLQLFFSLAGFGALLFALAALTSFAGMHYHRAARAESPAAGDLVDEVLGEAQDLAIVSLIAFGRCLVALAAPAFAALLLGAAFGAQGFASGALLCALVTLARAATLAEAPLLLSLRGHIPYEAVDRADENFREHRALFLLGVAPWPLLAVSVAAPLLLLVPGELPACLALGLFAPGFQASLARYHDLTYESRNPAG